MVCDTHKARLYGRAKPYLSARIGVNHLRGLLLLGFERSMMMVRMRIRMRMMMMIMVMRMRMRMMLMMRMTMTG